MWLTYYTAHHGRVVPARAGRLYSLHPGRPQKTTNFVEFYYPEEIVAFEREFVEAQQRLHGNLHRGRRDRRAHGRYAARLFDRGDNQVGPIKAPWKTACSTSMSGTGPSWASLTDRVGAAAHGAGELAVRRHGCLREAGVVDV